MPGVWAVQREADMKVADLCGLDRALAGVDVEPNDSLTGEELDQCIGALFGEIRDELGCNDPNGCKD